MKSPFTPRSPRAFRDDENQIEAESMSMLGVKRDEPAPGPSLGRPAAEAQTVLGRDARFDGKLHFEGEVRIDGKFEGQIFTDDLLRVGRGAEVKATLEVGSVIIEGRVEGDVIAHTSVEIKAPGQLEGNVTTPSLVVEKGVVFNGSCTMSEAPASSKPAVTPPPLPKTSNGTPEA